METFEQPKMPSPLTAALTEEAEALKRPKSARGIAFAAALSALTASGCGVTTTTVGGSIERTTSGRSAVEQVHHKWSDPRIKGDHRKLCAEIDAALDAPGTQQYSAEHRYKDGVYVLTGIELPDGRRALFEVTGPGGKKYTCR